VVALCRRIQNTGQFRRQKRSETKTDTKVELLFRAEKSKIADFRAGYASRADFCELLERNLKPLYLLAFLLTPNHKNAECCFSMTAEECLGEQAVFKEWAQSWIKRSLIKNVIGPRSPLGFKLSQDVPDTNLQELARHVLFGVCNVFIAMRKDPHPNEPAGRRCSEIACGEGSSSGIGLIEDREGKRMYGPGERIGAGGTEVAGIFAQKGACQKLGGVSGGTICQSVPIVSAECAGAIFPFLGIFARWIDHCQSCAKSRQNDGGWAEGFVGIDNKFVFNGHRSSGQSGRQNWVLIQMCSGDCRRLWKWILGLILRLGGIGKSDDHCIMRREHLLLGPVGHSRIIIL